MSRLNSETCLFAGVPEPTSFTKIAFGEGTYELSWSAPVLKPGQLPIQNYTIFWCNNERDRPYQCKGYLQWVEVSNTTIYNITVPDNEIFQFAISANTHNASSGMVWASCTVIHNRGEYYVPRNRVSRLTLSNSRRNTENEEPVDRSHRINVHGGELEVGLFRQDR